MYFGKVDTSYIDVMYPEPYPGDSLIDMLYTNFYKPTKLILLNIDCLQK